MFTQETSHALAVLLSLIATLTGLLGCQGEGAEPLQAAAAAHAIIPDVAVGPEIALDPPIISHNQGSGACGEGCAAASDGTDYLAVWTDYRMGEGCIFAARISREGRRLDPMGLPIGLGPRRQFRPRVVFGGDRYLVVWLEEGLRRRDVRGVLLDRAARLIGGPISIPIDGLGIGALALATDGTDFLLAAEQISESDDGQEVSHVVAVRISQRGELLDRTARVIASGWRSAAAFDGRQYVLTWQTDRSDDEEDPPPSDIRAARIHRSGRILDPDGIAIATGESDQVAPGLASDGTNSLIAWLDGAQIRAARLGRAGNRLDCTSFAVSPADGAAGPPRLTFDGAHYIVVWPGGDQALHGARVSRGGSVLDPDGFVLAADISESDLAGSGAGSLLVYGQESGTGSWLRAGRLSRAGALLDSVLLGDSASNWQGGLAVAPLAGRYLLAWQDGRRFSSTYGLNDIYATRLGERGQHIDRSAVLLSGDAPGSSPAVAAGEREALVVWNDLAGVRGARVSPAGAILDDPPLRIVSGSLGGAVSFAGGNYLVVSSQEHCQICGPRCPPGSSYRLLVTPVTPAGAVLPSIVVAERSAVGCLESAARPALASDGAHHLLVWRWRSSLTGTLLGADGAPLRSFDIASSATRPDAPSVAYGGGRFLVAWKVNPLLLSYDIYGARVSPDGLVLDVPGFAISEGAGDQLAPSVAYDGGRFLVTWQDDRGGAFDVYGARVGPSGRLLGTQLITGAAVDELAPVVASASPGHLLVGYLRPKPDNVRGQARILSP